MTRRFLITTVGSAGDVHPFVAIGRALRARGHAVLFAVNPHFEKTVRGAGLDFLAQGDAAALRRDLRSPDLMRGAKATLVVRRHFTSVTPASIEAVDRGIRELHPDLVLRHTMSHGVRWVARRHGVPCAVGTTTPGQWRSLADLVAERPPVVAALNRALVPLLWRAQKPVAAWAVERELHAIRREHGFPDESDLLERDWREGCVNLGLWSPHFRPPRPDDPPNGIVCGFPWFDGADGEEKLPAELEAFLDRGEPPLVFALGTTAVHAPGDFYRAAAEACAQLGERGVLLVGNAPPPDLTEALYERVVAHEYAPFSALLPRARAVVHHGGTGSIAQALRAGKPMLVVPHALDQPANAARAHRLGVGDVLPRGSVTAPSLAAALARLLGDAEIARRARELGADVARKGGAETAAVALEASLDARPA